MTIQEIKEAIKKPEYSFLKENEHLGDNICLLTVGGSHAYGTNIETSDLDIRGVAIERKNEIIGFERFDNFRNNPTDTEIHSLKKTIGLLLDGNPNIVELVGNLPEFYLYIDEIGKELIKNRKSFLSQRCIKGFKGYAQSNLKRVQNYLTRNLGQAEVEENALERCQNALDSFNDRYFPFEDGSIKLLLDTSNKDDLSMEIFCDVNISHYPLRDFKNIISELNQIVKSHGKLNKRNNKRTEDALNKHIMHLFRLLLTGIDILTKGDIITYRKDDHDFLMALRDGDYVKHDTNGNPIYDDVFAKLSDIEKKFKYAEENTVLPKIPNKEVAMDILSMAYNRYF